MSSLHPGDQLDHYRIENLVARSGMASIFRATDLRTGQLVAIKIPHPEVENDPFFLTASIAKRRSAGSWITPGVMKVMPDDEQSRLYMAMEWVDGRLLRQILNDTKKFPSERAVRVTLAILDALNYIHSRGIVHRDLKPENVMVNGNDQIKLIDFGIPGSAGSRRLTFTKMPQAMGTPDYISPEQVRAKRGDARSDLYAVGVMPYEMLTGKVPFTGSNPFLVMNDRLLNNPIPPREIDPQISPRLQEIIHRALERDPKKRYASAQEFAWDLEHPHHVGVADRAELRDWKRRRSPWSRKILLYILLALIPIAIFALLLLVARRA